MSFHINQSQHTSLLRQFDCANNVIIISLTEDCLREKSRIMKLSKALKIFGYSVVKLATMPVLLTPLHKYLNWYTSFYLFIFQFDLYTFINV